jgi:hypothetical protein
LGEKDEEGLVRGRGLLRMNWGVHARERGWGE